MNFLGLALPNMLKNVRTFFSCQKGEFAFCPVSGLPRTFGELPNMKSEEPKALSDLPNTLSELPNLKSEQPHEKRTPLLL